MVQSDIAIGGTIVKDMLIAIADHSNPEEEMSVNWGSDVEVSREPSFKLVGQNFVANREKVVHVNGNDESTSLAISLGARTPIISGHMLNTLRIRSISDHNMSSGQKSDTFKMYPVM